MKVLKIPLGLSSIQPIEERSRYNCNYYEIKSYGDWCSFLNGNNIIEETCYEDEDYCVFTLGHFEGDDFIGVLEWSSDYGEDLSHYIEG